MAQQRLSTERRSAIWQAHERRCIYCTELIPFTSLNIDHILPESLLTDKTQLSTVIEEYDLAPNFQITATENLVPSHAHCNNQKTNRIFSKNRAIYFLEIAASKIGKIADLESKLRAQAQRDKPLIALQILLERGELSAQELMGLLRKAQDQGSIVKLVESLQFSDRVVEGYINGMDITALLDEPILPSKLGFKNLEMIKHMPSCDIHLEVFSCNEWAEAVQNGFYTATTYAIKAEAIFKQIFGVLTAASQAQVATVNYLDEPRIDLTNIELLPVELLSFVSPDDRDELDAFAAKGFTIQDLVDRALVIVAEQNMFSLSLSYRGMELYTSELIRADINGDGFQDLLLSLYKRAIGGTLGFGEVVALTRRHPDASLEFLRDVVLEPISTSDT